MEEHRRGYLSGFRNSKRFYTDEPSHPFGNLFNAYTKAINKAYNRTGSLFEKPFGRIEVSSDAHFIYLVTYIHLNPQRHAFVDNFRDWSYSSYQAFLSDGATRLRRAEVLNWFDGARRFEALHQDEMDFHRIVPLIEDDFV